MACLNGNQGYCRAPLHWSCSDMTVHNQGGEMFEGSCASPSLLCPSCSWEDLIFPWFAQSLGKLWLVLIRQSEKQWFKTWFGILVSGGHSLPDSGIIANQSPSKPIKRGRNPDAKEKAGEGRNSWANSISNCEMLANEQYGRPHCLFHLHPC